METIYNDFTTKLLPKIQEGLVITKDYFTDLFSRYIKYLIITDIIWIGICVIFLIASVPLFKKARKIYIEDEYDGWVIILGIMCSVSFLIGIVGIINSSLNLAKDIYVPEVRVIEKIQYYRSNHD